MKKSKHSFKILFFLFVASIYSCNSGSQSEHVQHDAMDVAKVDKAICVLYATEGSTVSGEVVFTQTGSGIHVSANIQGLSEGKHGFHIHEYGDCSAADGTSAGGHFNPQENQHGAPADENRHIGDLGNLVAGPDGVATLDYTDSKLTFSGVNSIIGRGIIVHAAEDDLISQPTGNAGARVACGVIGVSQ